MTDEVHATSHQVLYRVLDPKRGFPSRQIQVDASRDDIQHLVATGYLIREQLLPPGRIAELRIALDKVAESERAQLSTANGTCFGGQYLRYLINKDEAFLYLYKLASTLSIARAVLGPQIQFDQVDARVLPAGVATSGVPWHTHLRVIPNPLPPFFSYPHAVHCLLYLDAIDEHNGMLSVIPGSHRDTSTTYPAGDLENKPGQVDIRLEAGDCFIMHGNLWHKTQASLDTAGPRRLLIFGYMPSWMRGDELGGIRPTRSLRGIEFKSADQETRELLGEFYWG